MSNKKHTAVEWIEAYLKTYTSLNYHTIIDKAKEIEREQITEAFKEGVKYWNGDEWKLIDIKQYYKETYEDRN